MNLLMALLKSTFNRKRFCGSSQSRICPVAPLQTIKTQWLSDIFGLVVWKAWPGRHCWHSEGFWLAQAAKTLYILHFSEWFGRVIWIWAEVQMCRLETCQNAENIWPEMHQNTGIYGSLVQSQKLNTDIEWHIKKIESIIKLTWQPYIKGLQPPANTALHSEICCWLGYSRFLVYLGYISISISWWIIKESLCLQKLSYS